MASRLETMSRLERQVRDRWLYGGEGVQAASHVHFGMCDSCGRVRDDDGRPLLVARRPGRRGFECLACFDLHGDH